MGQLKNAVALVRGFRRAFGIVDPGGVERLGDSVSPVYDLWTRPEAYALAGMSLHSTYQTIAAGGAGFRSTVQLWNPADSGRLVVVTAFYASAAGHEVRWYGTNLANLVSNLTYGCRDSRQLRSLIVADSVPIAQIRWANNAAAQGAQRWQLTTGRTAISFIIRPAMGLSVMPSADNTAFTAGFEWFEKDILPGEGTAELL